jgi:hypothetical protein
LWPVRNSVIFLFVIFYYNPSFAILCPYKIVWYEFPFE